MALEQRHGPSVLALTRQNLPALRTEPYRRQSLGTRRLCAAPRPTERRQVTMLGHRLRSLGRHGGARAAGGRRDRRGRRVDAVLGAVRAAGPDLSGAVLGNAPRIAVEAASPFGWTRYVASEGHVVGMTQLRRQRAGRGTVSAFRHDGRARGREGA